MGRRDGSRGAWVIRRLLVVFLAAAVALTWQSQAGAEDGDDVRVIEFLSADDLFGKELSNPRSVAVDSDGNVYVSADVLGRDDPSIVKFDPNGGIVDQWDHEETGLFPDGHLNSETIAVAPDESVYVVEKNRGRLLRFSGGKWSSVFASEIDSPLGVAVDSDGFIYVSNWGTPYGIMKFNRSGTRLWAATTASYESPNPFYVPHGLAVRDGSVYVADTGNHRVVKLDSESGNPIQAFNPWGSNQDNETFSWPRSVAVDSDGSVYVADIGNNRVVKFNANGGFLKEWDGFDNPNVVSVDSPDNVYVTDGTRVMKITTGASDDGDCEILDDFFGETDAGDLIDCGISETGFEIQAGQLESAEVDPRGHAGGSGSVVVKFNTKNPVPVKGKVVVTFPPGFKVTDQTKIIVKKLGEISRADKSNANPGESIIIGEDGQIATWLITNATLPNDELSAGARVSLELTNIVHPGVSGKPSGITIETTDPEGFTIDKCAESHGCAIEYGSVKPGWLTYLRFEMSERDEGDKDLLSTAAGSTGSVLVSFTPANPVPGGGMVMVTFPEGFVVGENTRVIDSYTEEGSLNSLDWGIVEGGSDDSARTVPIKIPEDIELVAEKQVSLKLSHVKNAGFTGYSKNGEVLTKDRLENTIDEGKTRIEGKSFCQQPLTDVCRVHVDLITPGRITSTDSEDGSRVPMVNPVSKEAGGSGDINVMFTLDNLLPGKGGIAVTFPAGFEFDSKDAAGNEGDTEARLITPNEGSLEVIPIVHEDGRTTALFWRTLETDLSENDVVKLVLTNIKNPEVSGFTGNFEIRTSVRNRHKKP